MSGVPGLDDPRQPKTFSFDDKNTSKAQAIIAKYPEGRQASAVLPLLDLAQRQNGGWLPAAAIEYVAEMLRMPSIRVWEVASFYTMFYLRPTGRYRVHVCTTTPCWLRGSDEITSTCERVLGLKFGQTSEDGQFSLHEVECAGACVNAPVVQINDDYYEDLTPETMERILDSLKRDEVPKAGSQSGRTHSAPAGGLTTLRDQGAAGGA